MPKEFDLEKLRGNENYHIWCFAIKNVIDYKGWSDCIVDPVKEEDSKKLSGCKAFLVLKVGSKIYVHISACTTALEVWQTLQRLYEDKGLSRKIGLLRGLISVRQNECDHMRTYV